MVDTTNKPDMWRKLVISSKDAVQEFNDYAGDRAIVWADNELRNYRRAMLLLIKTNPCWTVRLTEDEMKFVQTMFNRSNIPHVDNN